MKRITRLASAAVLVVVSVAAGPAEPAAGGGFLLGREGGADALRRLTPGMRAQVSYRLTSSTAIPFRFALGAHSVVRDHRVLANLDMCTAEPRTAVDIADGGNTLYLLATDGREDTSTGLTVHQLASVMDELDCADPLDMDGGALSTLATRDRASGLVNVRNHLYQERERHIPNGIAVFSR